jgi:hypothetical protein
MFMKRRMLADINLQRRKRGLDPLPRTHAKEIDTTKEYDPVGRVVTQTSPDKANANFAKPPPESSMSILTSKLTPDEMEMVSEDVKYFIRDESLQSVLDQELQKRAWS